MRNQNIEGAKSKDLNGTMNSFLQLCEGNQ